MYFVFFKGLFFNQRLLKGEFPLSLTHSINQSKINHSFIQSINQSIKHSFNQSINQSTNQQINQSVNHSINQSFIDSIIQSTNQSIYQLFIQSSNCQSNMEKIFMYFVFCKDLCFTHR